VLVKAKRRKSIFATLLTTTNAVYEFLSFVPFNERRVRKRVPKVVANPHTHHPLAISSRPLIPFKRHQITKKLEKMK